MQSHALTHTLSQSPVLYLCRRPPHQSIAAQGWPLGDQDLDPTVLLLTQSQASTEYGSAIVRKSKGPSCDLVSAGPFKVVMSAERGVLVL
jgi:hypothetical protein